MISSATVAPPYSIVLISDLQLGEIPESPGGGLILAAASCITVGCLSDADGPTHFTLGSVSDVDPGREPAFVGMLQTPTRRLALQTVLGEPILEVAVTARLTKVRVWVNDVLEPDDIIVGIG
jgi:hypothetical protein